MRYLIDISSRHSDKIQELLNKGKYDNLSQFFIAAVENQLMLEESNPQEVEATMKNEVYNSNPSSDIGKFSLSNSQGFGELLEVPDFSHLVFAIKKGSEKDIWLWGQINKLFPVKLGLRILQDALEGRRTMDLDEFLTLAARRASDVGDKVRNYEDANNKIRDDKVSAGLPFPNDDKSQTRYKFQFLAYQRKDDLLDGAMALFKFCNIIREKKNAKPVIGITEYGRKFSLLPNPILDKGDFEKSLSEEEIAFYLQHVKQHVKGEFSAIQWLLRNINSGFDDRESLNEKLADDFQKKWDASEAVLNTQRAGLTARVFELNLIEKEKTGIYVTYRLSPSGKQYLEQ